MEADAGHWIEAAAAFSEAIRVDPKDADAHFKLATAYQQLKRYPEAIKEYEATIRQNAGDGEANFRLGDLENDLGKPSEAIAPLKQAAILLPADAEAFDALGLSYLALEKFPEAIATYKQSIKLQPANPVTNYRLGWAYNGVAQYADAIESFNEAVRLQPNYVEAYSECGYLPLETNDKPLHRTNRRLRLTSNSRQRTTDWACHTRPSETAMLRSKSSFSYSRSGLGDQARKSAFELPPARDNLGSHPSTPSPRPPMIR